MVHYDLVDVNYVPREEPRVLDVSPLSPTQVAHFLAHLREAGRGKGGAWNGAGVGVGFMLHACDG